MHRERRGPTETIRLSEQIIRAVYGFPTRIERDGSTYLLIIGPVHGITVTISEVNTYRNIVRPKYFVRSPKGDYVTSEKGKHNVYVVWRDAPVFRSIVEDILEEKRSEFKKLYPHLEPEEDFERARIIIDRESSGTWEGKQSTVIAREVIQSGVEIPECDFKDLIVLAISEQLL